MRFDGSVARGVNRDGERWISSINGTCQQTHASMVEAMARVELELSLTGRAFVESFAEYEANRHKNKFSQAVDSARNGLKCCHATR